MRGHVLLMCITSLCSAADVAWARPASSSCCSSQTGSLAAGFITAHDAVAAAAAPTWPRRVSYTASTSPDSALKKARVALLLCMLLAAAAVAPLQTAGARESVMQRPTSSWLLDCSCSLPLLSVQPHDRHSISSAAVLNRACCCLWHVMLLQVLQGSPLGLIGRVSSMAA
jgi:hypothetical protein